MGKKKAEPTREEIKAEMKWAAIAYDGVEVPRPEWALAEEIVKENPGEFMLGGARGAGGDWKRLEPIEDD